MCTRSQTGLLSFSFPIPNKSDLAAKPDFHGPDHRTAIPVYHQSVEGWG
ncbi:hypothetical protein [Nibrella saemangeumensis]